MQRGSNFNQRDDKYTVLNSLQAGQKNLGSLRGFNTVFAICKRLIYFIILVVNWLSKINKNFLK